LTAQVSELTKEKDSLSLSLDEERDNDKIIEANTKLIDCALMYFNETGDSMDIADSLELISSDYLEDYASESFINLYNALKEEIGSDVAKASYNTGYAAYKNQDYETAITDLKRAVEYDATNGEALYILGNSYYKSEKLDEALEIYEQVVELFPGTEKARKSQSYIKEISGN
jgi:tetratricopeptide (TPR) repeat protein